MNDLRITILRSIAAEDLMPKTVLNVVFHHQAEATARLIVSNLSIQWLIATETIILMIEPRHMIPQATGREAHSLLFLTIPFGALRTTIYLVTAADVMIRTIEFRDTIPVAIATEASIPITDLYGMIPHAPLATHRTTAMKTTHYEAA